MFSPEIEAELKEVPKQPPAAQGTGTPPPHHLWGCPEVHALIPWLVAGICRHWYLLTLETKK